MSIRTAASKTPRCSMSPRARLPSLPPPSQDRRHEISTPTATLGIRGTSGLVEVPEGASATSRNNVAIKLYPDADGKVGRIEVNDPRRCAARLSHAGRQRFHHRPGAGGARFAAVPLTISPQQALRDQGFVRQVHSTQNLGRRVVTEQRGLPPRQSRLEQP